MNGNGVGPGGKFRYRILSLTTMTTNVTTAPSVTYCSVENPYNIFPLLKGLPHAVALVSGSAVCVSGPLMSFYFVYSLPNRVESAIISRG